MTTLERLRGDFRDGELLIFPVCEVVLIFWLTAVLLLALLDLEVGVVRE